MSPFRKYKWLHLCHCRKFFQWRKRHHIIIFCMNNEYLIFINGHSLMERIIKDSTFYFLPCVFMCAISFPETFTKKTDEEWEWFRFAFCTPINDRRKCDDFGNDRILCRKYRCCSTKTRTKHKYFSNIKKVCLSIIDIFKATIQMFCNNAHIFFWRILQELPTALPASTIAGMKDPISFLCKKFPELVL